MTEKTAGLVWDLPTRLFHWLLAGLVCFSWYCIEIKEDLDWHFISGYCVLSLLLFRIAWGFLGTRYVKFKNMLFGPAKTRRYASTFFSASGTHYSGHNPLGSLSVFALLGLLLVQVGTGLFANDEDYYFGPLSNYVSTRSADLLTEIHHVNFDILTAFIVLHISAVIFYLLFRKENLVKAMITGKKPLLDASKAIKHSKLPLALLTLILSASAVSLLVYLA